jgi:secretion/DNA translocation related TadE-like protein
MLLVWITQVGLLLGWLVARQHQVDAAADLAALSAAADLQGGGAACPTARQVASANHADLRACQVDGMDVGVEVAAVVDLPLGLHVVLRGVAGAGP